MDGVSACSYDARRWRRRPASSHGLWATVARPSEISPAPELRSLGSVPQDVARERDYLTCVVADAINMRRVDQHRAPPGSV